MSTVTETPHPLPWRVAGPAVLRCVVRSARLLLSHRVHLRPSQLGRQLRFADGTTARVYRETVVDTAPPGNPCVVVVGFRLRALRGRWHAGFRRESLLNTPLFVGFPGFVSKLWLAHDERGRYRGLYEWDGPWRAEHYARCVWRVLELVSVPGSISYAVVPGLRRDAVLARPQLLEAVVPAAPGRWWLLVEA